MGLEPTNGGTTILCLNHLATPAVILLQLEQYNTLIVLWHRVNLSSLSVCQGVREKIWFSLLIRKLLR